MGFEPSVFINLPIRDLRSSMEFFEGLGFKFNPQFTDKNAACLILGNTNYVMLLLEDFFRSFSEKKIIDASADTEMILAISVESRAAVDSLVDKAFSLGAKPSNDSSDMGFMYSRSFQDLDNHNWEVFYMDPAHLQ